MRVLALNAGSSTLKTSIVEGERVVATSTLRWDEAGGRREALERAMADVRAATDLPAAVAHRVVHGGERFTRHAVLDDETLAEIAAVSDLAPLHNTPAVETIEAAREIFPDVTHVACFDTAFHAGLPAAALRYPVPESWHAAGIRRYGFHGLSVESATDRAAQLLDRPVAELHLVVAHLGSGSSVTAVAGGRSAWTSMGYTPLDGLMMGTRPGSLDPGILLDVLRRDEAGGALDRLSDALEHRSGLLGVSGTTSDVRELETHAGDGDEAARLALEMFVAHAAAGVAAAATWLPGLDALVFTGGIGENAGRLRAAVVARLAALGFASIPTDEPRNDRVIAVGPPAVLRVEAREDVVMARAAERLTAGR